MRATRNIGGSILPSNSPEVLSPLETSFGTLQVRVLEKEDTHALYLGDKELARHPNGFSCRNLAKRMAAGDLTKVLEQAHYIVSCGGTSLDDVDLHDIMSPKEGDDNLRAVIRRSWDLLEREKASAVRMDNMPHALAILERQMQTLRHLRERGISTEGLEPTTPLPKAS